MNNWGWGGVGGGGVVVLVLTYTKYVFSTSLRRAYSASFYQMYVRDESQWVILLSLCLQGNVTLLACSSSCFFFNDDISAIKFSTFSLIILFSFFTFWTEILKSLNFSKFPQIFCLFVSFRVRSRFLS